MGRSKFDPNAFIDWLDRVPEENRKRLATIFSETPVTDYESLVKFSQSVMVQVLSGNIAPIAAEAAARWAEIMLTSLAAKHSAEGTTGGAYADLVGALAAVQSEAIEASYTEVEYAEAVNE